MSTDHPGEELVGFGTTSWVVWSRSDHDTAFVQEGVDRLLHGYSYSYYPEVEWPVYGYRAPDGYGVLGAWRHPERLAFVFLLDEPLSSGTTPNTRRLLIFVGGPASERSRFDSPIWKLKTDLYKAVKQEHDDAYLEKRLAAAQRIKPTKQLLGFFGLFVAGFDVFQYTWKALSGFPGRGFLLTGHSLPIFVIQFIVLPFLLVFIIVCLAFALKYGVRMLWRL